MVHIEKNDDERTKVVNGEIIESSREDEGYFTNNWFVLLDEEIKTDDQETKKPTTKKSK